MKSSRNRQAFTLIELIAVLVILGILSAFAVPKFKYLLYQSQVTPLTQAYQNFFRNGIASYMNMTEINGVAADQVEISDLFKVNPPPKSSQTAAGYKRWVFQSTNKRSKYFYYISRDNYISFAYRKKAGPHRLAGYTYIIINIKGENKTIYQSIIAKRLKITFHNGKYRIKVNMKTGEESPY